MAILHRMFEKPIFRSSTGMEVDGQSKFLTHTFPDPFLAKHETLEIIVLTDVQFGHICCKVDKFIEYRDWVLEKPYRFCLFGGDMIDAYRIGSPGTGYDNLFMPDTQAWKFCEMVAPLKHRVLGFVGGNHERRGLAGGLDWGNLLSFMLEIPYSNGGQMIAVKFGPKWSARGGFPIYLWHGRGAARTAGAQVNMTLSAVPNDEALVYFSGHIHNSHAKVCWRMKREHKKMTMTPERYYVVSASSFLEHYGSYNEVFGGTYSGLHMPVLNIHADGRYRVEL